VKTHIRLPYFRLGKLHTELTHHRENIASIIHKFMQVAAKQLAAHVRKQVKVRKTAEDDVLSGLDSIPWADLALDTTKDIVAIATEYARRGLYQLGISDATMMTTVNEAARKWATDRAAAMVGMQYDDSGNLVDNPNAEWSIAQTTREDIQELVTQAFAEHTTINELADQILEATTFSQYRANMVAATEASNAQANGSLSAWQESGVVEEISVMLSFDHGEPDECDDVVDSGPYTVQQAIGCCLFIRGANVRL